MAQYIVFRLLLAVPTIVMATMAVFLAIHFVPGDPVRNQLGLDADPAVIAQMKEDYGLDQPLPIQYGKWAWHVVRGDWGKSIYTHEPVLTEFRHRLPISLELGVISLAVAFAVAVFAGVASAMRPGGWADFSLMTVAMLGISAPEFLTGALAILVLSVKLGWLDPIGWTPLTENPMANVKTLILPSLSLGLARAALLSRLVRSETLEVLSQDYIRTARAKGLRSSKIITRHVLKNAMIPVVTVLGLQVSGILAGAVIVESLFGLPGLGTYGVDAFQKRDFPAIEGFVLFVTLSIIISNLVVDIAYSWLNPRIRQGAG